MEIRAGRYYKIPLENHHYKHIPSGRIIESEEEIQSMIAYEDADPKDFRDEFSGNGCLFFKVKAITVYDRNDKSSAVDSDVSFKGKKGYSLEYSCELEDEEQVYIDHDYLSDGILLTSDNDIAKAKRRINAWKKHQDDMEASLYDSVS